MGKIKDTESILRLPGVRGRGGRGAANVYMVFRDSQVPFVVAIPPARPPAMHESASRAHQWGTLANFLISVTLIAEMVSQCSFNLYFVLQYNVLKNSF